MANSWFKFKQFTVEQGKTAMKVGTDGVLLGAWATVDGASTVLDVGTGTGLIALMVAQRNGSAAITAIDIDEGAFEQATENFSNSPWSSRLAAQKSDYNHYDGGGATFDLIVSNPPFFRQSLKPSRAARSLARHDHQLAHEMLIEKSLQLLSPNGRFSLILPYVEGSVFIAEAASRGLYCIRKTNVYPKPGADIKRLLLEFARFQQPLSEDDLVIEDRGRHGYSKDYLELTASFYLFG